MAIERAHAWQGLPGSREDIPKCFASHVPGDSTASPAGTGADSLAPDASRFRENSIERSETDQGLFEKLQDGLQSFFDAISNFGKSDGKSPGSVAAGVVCGLVAVLTLANVEALQNIGPEIHRAFNAFGTMLDTNADDALRKVFSGFCAFSSLLRTVNPILMEISSQTQDGATKLIVGTAALVLQAVYVGTSFIASLLAARDAIRDVPKEKDLPSLIERIRAKLNEQFREFIAVENKFDYLKNFMERQIRAQREILKNAGMKGGLTSAREVLLCAGAVLSLVALAASAPALLIAAGACNFVANISEIKIARMDWKTANNKVNELVACKQQLEIELGKTDSGAPQHAELRKKLELVVKELNGAEKDRHLALVRFVKGTVGAIAAVSSIVTGTLFLALKITVPWWPLIATVLSMLCVTALGAYNFALRCSNDRARAQAAIDRAAASPAAQG
jgi:hypothetical protein